MASHVVLRNTSRFKSRQMKEPETPLQRFKGVTFVNSLELFPLPRLTLFCLESKRP